MKRRRINTAFTISALVLATLLVLLPLVSATASRLERQPREIDVSLSGWFTIIWGDPEPGLGGEPIEIYMLTDDTGQSTQLLLSEELARSLGGTLFLNRKRVIVEGKWVRTMVMQTQSIRLDVQSNTQTARWAVQSVSGPQPWISILCKFADVADEPKPLSYFQGMYSSAYPGLDHYWRELSYDIANVEGSSAVGWYTLPQPRSYYVYDEDGDGYEDLDHSRAADDCTAVADAYVYFPDYVGVNLMFNDDLDGYAWGGGYYMTRDGVTQVWHMTWEPPWGYEDVTVIEHEMGHGFGLPHSSGAYGQTYDNQWDVMSDTWSNCSLSSHPVYGCLGQHTISYHKDILGWIPAGQKYVATAFSQTVTLEQLALPQTGNYKMVQIPIGGSANYFYTVEVRRKVGYDVKLPGQAVIIHEVDTSRDRPAHVVDVDGNGNTGDDGAMWTVGETFSDAVNSISVSVDSATVTGFVVTITFKPTPTQLSPANDSSMLVGDVTFTWTPVPDASSYQIQIDTVPTFDSAGLIDQTLAGTSYTRSFTTLSIYYWRVRALPDGPYSSIWRFSIAYPLIQVTIDPADDWQPAIARTNDSRLWVVWDSWRSDSNIWYKTSDDNGVTWPADTQLTTDPSSDYDPAIMQASDGTIWVVWYSYRSGNADIWYKTSAYGGAIWSADTRLTTDPNGDYSPAIMQTSGGTIWVVWYSYRSGNADIWYKTSSDGGATWSSDVQLTTASQGDYRPAIIQTSNGIIWMLWDSWRTDHPGIWYKISTDGGASWSPDAKLSTDTNWDYMPTIAQTSDGTIWVARMSWSWDLWNWDIWYRISTDGGITWSADQQFTRFTGLDFYPGFAALPDNHVALVWSSDRAVNFDVWCGIIGVHGDVNPPPHLDFIQNYPWPNPDSNDTVTIRADVSDETGIANVTLKWWVNGTPQADLTMYDDGAHDDYGPNDGWYGVQIGPFPVGTIVEYQVEVTDVDGNTILAPQYPIWFESLEPFVKTADILFVPDYGGYDTGWFRGYYEDALGTQGYQYDVWDTSKRGEIDSMTLNQYIDGAVIWAVPYWGFVTDYTSTRDVLQSYLDNGGNLFITGQNIGRSLAGTDFYQNYLHANYVQDNVGLYALSGIAGDPIGDGLSLSITGGDGANNQYSPDEIDPVSPAVTILTYSGGALAQSELRLPKGIEEREPFVEPGLPVSEGRPMQRKGPEQRRVRVETQGVVSSGSGAIRVDTGTYKVVYFAFGFEGINSAGDRQLVMERILDWTWSLPGDLDFNCIVNVADIQRVASRWRMTDTDPDWNPRYDLNGDGIITVVDIMLVVKHWGETCEE